jgi:O-antigen/teichoic acid export membrane protein
MLGPAGLGVVFVGFASYLIALGFQRALILQPLVVTSGHEDAAGRRMAAGHAVTACAVGAVASSVLVLGIGLVIPGDVGRGMTLFGPWLAPVILQDLWRSVLFRDDRGPSAALNDGLWLLTMAVTLPLLLWAGSDWAVVSWWGFGGLVAAVAGFMQVAPKPTRFQESWRWWRSGASLSGWLLLESAVVYAGAQGAVLILAPIVGSTNLGGLRAAETVFVPMSFLKPAIELPGLPAMSRAVRRSSREATTLAVTLSGASVAVTLAYLGIMALIGARVLRWLFGAEFSGFDSLIEPFGTGQAFAALAVGFIVLLKAQRRGRALVLAGAGGAVAALALAPVLASTAGVEGAAWALAFASGVSAVTTMFVAFQYRRARGAE